MSGFKCPERFILVGTAITVMSMLFDRDLTKERFVELSVFSGQDIREIP